MPWNNVWDPNSRKFVPAKHEKWKILELKLPRKFHATGFPAEEYYKNLLSFPLDSDLSNRLCYPLHCCSSNHINVKKKNPADKQFLLSAVVRKFRWLEAYLSFISCFFCLKVLCSCERRFILKPVKVRATCGMVSSKKDSNLLFGFIRWWSRGLSRPRPFQSSNLGGRAHDIRLGSGSFSSSLASLLVLFALPFQDYNGCYALGYRSIVAEIPNRESSKSTSHKTGHSCREGP